MTDKVANAAPLFQEPLKRSLFSSNMFASRFIVVNNPAHKRRPPQGAAQHRLNGAYINIFNTIHKEL
ncbi:MAG: hypothetical protein JKY68_07270 [Rhodospirillales bacterium]|nr:hypothetical protein [Rhodospirillales bacterium]